MLLVAGVVMVLDSLLAQIAVALVGGLAAEMLHWYALARKPGALAKYRLRPVYWITTIGMILLGGIMPLLYVQGSASALLCFHLGAATPVIVQKLIAAVESGNRAGAKYRTGSTSGRQRLANIVRSPRRCCGPAAFSVRTPSS
jgi:hypothetical protein